MGCVPFLLLFLADALLLQGSNLLVVLWISPALHSHSTWPLVLLRKVKPGGVGGVGVRVACASSSFQGYWCVWGENLRTSKLLQVAARVTL